MVHSHASGFAGARQNPDAIAHRTILDLGAEHTWEYCDKHVDPHDPDAYQLASVVGGPARPQPGAEGNGSRSALRPWPLHRRHRGVHGGSVAHCLLHPGMITKPVRHRSTTEIWFVLGGHGEFRRSPRNADGWTTRLRYGTCVDIEAGEAFQFRAS
jgi:mannose-6-phosphate isomerase-like protein (cupin superfamily)